MNYETIEKAYKITNELSEEKRMIVQEVIDFADSCYIDHCESLGSQAIEIIESSKEDFKQDVLLKLKTLIKEIEEYA